MSSNPSSRVKGAGGEEVETGGSVEVEVEAEGVVSVCISDTVF